MEFPDSMRQQLIDHQQEHLIQFWDQLTETNQAALLRQIEEIDFDLLQRLLKQRDEKPQEAADDRADVAQSPQSLILLPETDGQLAEQETARTAGEELLSQGKVGALLVAGGQGSRLGFDQPKGMFPVGPVTERTLFQILCEQLRARAQRANVTIPYFIMTSEATHTETVDFFQESDYFGLGEENVYFFQQASLPAVADDSHQILLQSKGRIATSPDGHGGTLSALHRHGMLDVMRERGIEHLFYHQVDNPTAIVCDPVLLGYHIKHQSNITTKVVAKVSPEEKMGVLVSVDGRTQIIEYSDLSPEQAARQDESGNYVFWAGNTAIHVFERAFIERLVGDDLSLPFHIAHKKVACIDTEGNTIEPSSNNAHKFEQFIFDALPDADVALVVEADRQREFNPVKNAEGSDSPATSRAALSRIAREWVSHAGGIIQNDATVEISPLTALSPDDLIDHVQGKTYSEETVL